MLQLSKLAARVRASAPAALAWAKRRAGERSTWIGLAAVAGGLGKSVWADHLTSMADVVPMLLGAGGAALAAASTNPRPPAPDADSTR
ncbi:MULTISPECIES: hypothetical protein [unclassified Sphingomonas]|uniref:hypothetical protein n=1 Tax=unclassified Sphingomonas TaxID=196159 RepID=UPI00226A302B|nr:MULTISPECIES: hypothetical protein [unclassified Sphingomonas]